MALPTVTELKSYLRIQHTAEDALLASLLASARAAVRGYVGRPLTTEPGRVVVIEELSACGKVLILPVTPYDPASIVLEDADGTTVATTDYRVPSGWDGAVRATSGARFANPPYTGTYDVGLGTSQAPDYATEIEPVLRQAILDTAADLYQRRNPAAQAEGAGGGVYTQFGTGVGLPARVMAMLAPWRVVRFA